jgi:hAT family C-terminal dimerisation region
MKSITDHVFIVAFHVVRHFFGYVRGLSTKLQVSTLDVIQGYKMVANVTEVLKRARMDDSEWEHIYQKASKMAVEPITAPRVCSSKHAHRSNTPTAPPEVCFKRNIYLPFLDSLIQQFNLRFGDLETQAIRALNLIPSNVVSIETGTADAILDYYRNDLLFMKEFRLWQQMWRNVDNRPNTLSDTLSSSQSYHIMYPNFTKIFHILLLTSVTSCDMERANSSLRFVKSCFRGTMSEDRFNALILLFVHKDIDLDIDAVINIYARRHPRRMVLLNPSAHDSADH